MEAREVTQEEFNQAGRAGQKLNWLANIFGAKIMVARKIVSYKHEDRAVDSVYFTSEVDVRQNHFKSNMLGRQYDLGVKDALTLLFSDVSSKDTILESAHRPVQEKIYLKATDEGNFVRQYPVDQIGFNLSDHPGPYPLKPIPTWMRPKA